MDTAVLEKQAMQLPDVEHALLADHLIESLSRVPLALKEAWAEEAEHRMAAYRRGEIAALDAPEALAALRSQLAK